MKKIIITLLIPVGLALFFVMCQHSNGKDQPQARLEKVDESAVAVTVVPVQSVATNRSVNTSGLIGTSSEARLSFKIGGFINNILVEEGATVTKGQLLATLNKTEINAQVEQARSGLEKSKRDLERGERLYADSAATLEMIQNLKTAYTVAQETYNVATYNQQHAEIRSTMNGKVVRKLSNEGEFVGPGMPIFMVNAANQNEWIIKAGLPDVDWVRTKVGDKAIVHTDAYPDQPLEARVSLVGEGSDPLTGLYPIEVKINAGGRKLASGLFGKVEIWPSAKQSLLAIPIESLVEGSGRDAFVFVPEGNRVKKVPIQIAFLQEDKALVAKGLDSTQSIVKGGSAFLTEYSTITIKKD